MRGNLGLLLATLTLSFSTAEPLKLDIELTYPRPTAQRLTEIVWGPPGFVAGTVGNQILYSADGFHWEAHFLDAPPLVLTAAFYYDGTYIAGGNNGQAFRSHDGRNWESILGLPDLFFTCGIGAEGKFILVSSNNLLLSENGRHWDQLTINGTFRDIAYGNGTWVGVGGRPYYSSDLTNWIPAMDSFRLPYVNSVAFGNNRFVAVGAWNPDAGGYSASVILYSDNGQDWSFAPSEALDSFGELRDVTFANGQFVATRDSRIFRSSDGINWTISQSGALHNLHEVAGSPNGTFVAVGETGEILCSQNTPNWTRVNAAPRDWIQGLGYGGGRFVAVAGTQAFLGEGPGSSAVFSSTDGLTWHASLTNGTDQLTGAAYGLGLWVVTGDNGQIFTSTNTLTWENYSLNTPNHDLRDVVFGNGRFVAFAPYSDRIYHSSNGKDWTFEVVPSMNAMQVTRFLNGAFIALEGGWGTILTSLDGLDWKTHETEIDLPVYAITYGAGKYVTGGSGMIYYSNNLTNWISVPTSFSALDLEFIDGQYVAFSYSGIFASPDAIHWEPANVKPRGIPGLAKAAYGNGILVATDGQPNLYRALTPLSPKLRVNRLGNDLIIRWPSLYSGAVIQYAIDLSGPWIEATGEPQVQDEESVLQFNSSIRARFFRLKFWPN